MPYSVQFARLDTAGDDYFPSLRVFGRRELGHRLGR
jgi:hypothetical protein